MKKMMTQSLWLFNCVGNLNISVSLLRKAGTEDHAYIYIPPIENKTTNTTNQCKWYYLLRRLSCCFIVESHPDYTTQRFS